MNVLSWNLIVFFLIHMKSICIVAELYKSFILFSFKFFKSDFFFL